MELSPDPAAADLAASVAASPVTRGAAAENSAVKPASVVEPSAGASNADANGAVSTPAYPAAASRPTQSGVEGICFDFNEGARVLLPARETGVWRARLLDLDSGNVLFETNTNGGLVRSSKRWFVRFRVEVSSAEDGAGEGRLVLAHDYDANGRETAGASASAKG